MTARGLEFEDMNAVDVEKDIVEITVDSAYGRSEKRVLRGQM